MDHGYLLKFKRAEHHLQDLHKLVVGWINANGDSVIHEVDPQGSDEFDFRIRAMVTSVPEDPFSLIVGDILHNIRSGLDHLVHALSITNARSGSGEIGFTQFPICGTEREFLGDRATLQMSLLDGPAKRAIMTRQPYHAGDSIDGDPLWNLAKLSNFDKHRLLHPAVFAFPHYTITRDPRYELQRLDPCWGRLNPDAVLVRYRAVPVDPCRDVQVNLKPQINVSLSTGIGDEAAVPFLDGILRHARIVASEVARSQDATKS